MVMKKFMDDNFMLNNETATKLFNDYAKDMPIFDYHCHLSPQMMYEDKPFENITQIFLGGDHYKWRYMRSNGIDESYITFVILRLLIDQVKDTLCTGKCHDDGVKLLCHLHERLCKALGKLQVGSHDTKCDPPNSCNGKDPAENCCQDKLQVSDVSDYRSHHICKGICLCSTFKERLVEFVKFFF